MRLTRDDAPILYILAFLVGFAVPSLWGQAFPDRKAILVTARAAYGPTLTQAEAGTLLNRVAWQLRSEGFGLLRKDGGNRCPMPNGTMVACDWLVHRPSGTGCDVLMAGPDDQAPGPSTPTWCGGEPFDATRFVAPVDPGGANSEANPRVTSPLDDAYLRAAIAASWAGTRGGAVPEGDMAYWLGKAQQSEQYSDGVWRRGWNAYWEARLLPGNEGSADVRLADQPARYQPSADCQAAEARAAVVESARLTAEENERNARRDREAAVQERDAAIEEREQLRAELAALKALPPPRCEASVWGFKVKCRVIQP